jgi:hypothetical protein
MPLPAFLLLLSATDLFAVIGKEFCLLAINLKVA